MRTHLKFTRNLVAILSLLTVFGCGADPSTIPDSSSSSAVESAETASNDDATTSTSESKSTFVATLLSGQTFDSQKVLENQPLALWFWAPG
jgi:predicted small lipoprotein YifL